MTPLGLCSTLPKAYRRPASIPAWRFANSERRKAASPFLGGIPCLTALVTISKKMVSSVSLPPCKAKATVTSTTTHVFAACTWLRPAAAVKLAAFSFLSWKTCTPFSLMQVLDALADDRIDPKRAGLMLYGLQQTATILNSNPEWKGARPEVTPDQPLLAVEAPPLQQQLGLPENLDLDLPPDTALQQAEAGIRATTQKRRLSRIPHGIRDLRKRIVEPNSFEAMRMQLDQAIREIEREEREATYLTDAGLPPEDKSRPKFIVRGWNNEDDSEPGHADVA
jgi:hypothetical protein